MYIVTGGAGFIGSNLVHALEERGHRDTVVSDVLGTDDKWRNLAKRELESVISPGELFPFLDRHVAQVSVIFHMGAISSTTEMDVDAILANNIRLSQDLWRWCARHNKRLIYASSAATYGSGEMGFEDKEDRSSLESLRPLNAYGWSKHFFDRWVARQNEVGGTKPPQCVGLKFFNVYGPNEYHKGSQRSLVVQAFETIMRGDPVTLFKSNTPAYEDGGQLRDFIYVKDCVDVMLWFLDHPSESGLFNVGTGKARSFKDLVLATYAALEGQVSANKMNKINYKEMPESLSVNYQNYTQSINKKINSLGCHKKPWSLEKGVADYVNKYLLQKDKYL